MKKLLVITLATLAMAFQASAGIKAAEVPEKAKEFAAKLESMKPEDKEAEIAKVLSSANNKYGIKSADVKSMLAFLNEVGVADSNKLVSYIMKVAEVEATGDKSAVNLKSAALQVTKALIEASKFTGDAKTDAKTVLNPFIGASGVLFEHASTDGAALNKLANQIYSMNVAINAKARGETVNLEDVSKKAFKRFLLGTDSKLTEAEIEAQYRKWKEDCKA
ncbi:MAG: hypothetical protein L6Q37_14535 [Bdellovibrionaceae bacterium]|nr:hypothetical protein [Pseudobdellovibrionaceae bacterium]NUM58119.1 hypothetical protein [Pseudobdellovibrionaceae bacterium]